MREPSDRAPGVPFMKYVVLIYSNPATWDDPARD